MGKILVWLMSNACTKQRSSCVVKLRAASCSWLWLSLLPNFTTRLIYINCYACTLLMQATLLKLKTLFSASSMSQYGEGLTSEFRLAASGPVGCAFEASKHHLWQVCAHACVIRCSCQHTAGASSWPKPARCAATSCFAWPTTFEQRVAHRHSALCHKPSRLSSSGSCSQREGLFSSSKGLQRELAETLP